MEHTLRLQGHVVGARVQAHDCCLFCIRFVLGPVTLTQLQRPARTRFLMLDAAFDVTTQLHSVSDTQYI